MSVIMGLNVYFRKCPLFSLMVGIARPDIRRHVCARVEKNLETWSVSILSCDDEAIAFYNEMFFYDLSGPASHCMVSLEVICKDAD